MAHKYYDSEVVAACGMPVLIDLLIVHLQARNAYIDVPNFISDLEDQIRPKTLECWRVLMSILNVMHGLKLSQ
jgi:hypothetical protein